MEEQVQSIINIFKLISFVAIGAGVAFAMYYLAGLRRFITLWRHNRQDMQEGGDNVTGASLAGTNLGIIRLVLKRGSLFSGDLEQARLVARKRLLIFIIYFALIVVASVVGAIIMAAAAAR